MKHTRDHLTEQAAYLEGWDCHREGGSANSNPYLDGTLARELWAMGYADRGKARQGLPTRM